MKRAKVALLLISCATVLSLSGLPARADSWDRDRWNDRSEDRWEDRWDNRWDNRWGDRPSSRAYRVRPILDRLANHTNTFQYVFDRELDRSRIDGSRREDRLNERVRDFTQLVYAARSSYQEGRGGRYRLRQVVDRGYALDRLLQGSPRRRYWQREWRLVRQSLQDLDRSAAF